MWLWPGSSASTARTESGPTSNTEYRVKQAYLRVFDPARDITNRVNTAKEADQQNTPARTTIPAKGMEASDEMGTDEVGIMKIAEVLNRIYRMSEENDEHNAIDVVCDFMDDNLLAGNLEVCEDTLKQANVNKLLPSLIISFLMATRRAKQYLPSRKEFIDAALAKIAKERGETVAESLLGKYR